MSPALDVPCEPRRPARLTPKDVRKIEELRYGDGLSVTVVAQRVGCSPMRVHQLAPGRPGKIDNEVLRGAFVQRCERRRMTESKLAREVAVLLGWRRVSPDGWHGEGVLRTLGLRADDGRGQPRRWIDAELAGDISDALGCERWEHGGC